MTTRWMFLLAAMTLGACVSSTVTDDGYAPSAIYRMPIATCMNGAGCDPLCMVVFQLSPDETIDSCKITSLDAGGAHVHVQYETSDGGSYDDGGDNGCIDDGSCGDGSDDGSDDGGDDGSDDGSTDDSRMAPIHHRVHATSAVNDPR